MDFTLEKMNFTTNATNHPTVSVGDCIRIDPTQNKVVNVGSKQEQAAKLLKAKLECDERISNYTLQPYKELYCDTTWDGIMCWEAVPAGTVAKMKCPEYVNGISEHGFAYKTCTSNGTWYSVIQNKSWTDYGGCLPAGQSFVLITEHLPKIRLMYNIGYGLSLCSLVVAVIIMVCCRRLHSKSNTMHINLFLAFIMRAFMSFLKESLFVYGLGLQKDIIKEEDGSIKFIEEGTHWECKLLYCIFIYGVSVNCMWIFMEALYLHMLVYRTLWTERNGVKMYMVLGWLGPLLFIVPWIIVRAAVEDENKLCWNTNPTPEFMWIISGPIIFTTVVNFVFFVNIVRVLFNRVHTNKRVTGARKVRKLAKFIVVLIPLFGVVYIIFNIMYTPVLNEDTDIPFFYCEMFYNSFQGFFLALLFCFLNEEVHLEFKKLWYRYALRRNDSHVYTRTAILSSWRHNSQNSRAHSINEPSIDSSGGLRQFRTTRNNNDKLLSKHVKTTPPGSRSRSLDSRHNMLAGGVKMETCVNSNCRFLTLPEKKNQNHDEIELCSDSV